MSDKSETRLMMRSEISSSYLVYTGHVVRHDGNQWTGVRDYDDWTLANLAVRAQAERDSERPYGWQVGIQASDILDSATLAKAARDLSRIEKRMDKYAETEGAPTSFGQFCNRVARALGCVGIVTHRANQRGTEYESSQMTWTLADMAHVIDAMFADYVKRFESTA